MKRFKIKINVEKEVYAKDKEEALQIFWHEIESTPQQDIATFIDEHTEVEELE